ncbi:hypothetical protein HY857_00260 [Candidatus Saccharibacteria bacterium]|nr:hypothetical protein [Candidatus Saccharibacteria bacterium]
MERPHRLEPKYASRQIIASVLGTAALIGGIKGVSYVIEGQPHSPKQERIITIGPSAGPGLGNGNLFPSLPAAVQEISSKNPALGREDIRQRLADEVEAQLDDLGIPRDEYKSIQPGEDVQVEVPGSWGVGTPKTETNPKSDS